MERTTGLMGLWAMAILATGCGSTALTYQCDPACPSGMHCTESGCVLDNAAGADLTTVAGDLIMTCNPPCSGATPYCGAQLVCLACLEDAHCPMGQVCTQTGATSVCVPGCNDDSRCPAAQSKCCGHECVDPMTDRENCGTCGNACQSSHAPASCAGGACVPGPCQAGWGDCNQNPADGCETLVANDPANCGQCGTACHYDNATAGCSNDCYIAACQFGFGDCDGDPANGCEGNTLTDNKNCGDCGNVCSTAPHAKVACVNAACELTECAVGFGDCNGLPNDGCEANVLIDAKNCGVCGGQCPMGLVCRNGGCTCPQCNFPNAASKCVNNACVMGKCVEGFGDCNQLVKDGCEVDLTSDSANCSACGMACGMGQTCNSGVCEDIRPDVMQCGNSQRNVADFYPMGMKFNLRNGCNPDANVQALLIDRNWNNGIGAQALQDYLNDGGIVLTEFIISHLVWNEAFGTNAVMGPRQGQCSDKMPTMFQFNPDDQFWLDNLFVMDPNTGCGYAVQAYPGITAISGWDAVNVAVGYQNLGSGRVWATDFDWQDTDTKGPAYDYTNGLLGYMITHRR